MKNRTLLQIGLAVLPIIVSLVVTALIILSVGSDPVEVFETAAQGAFRDDKTIAAILNFWIPLTFCCLGLVITFNIGLWNIGIEGQIVMGAVFASWGAQFLSLPMPLQIGAEILLAMLGGMLWAAVVGFLKLRLKVHEIFGGVALNALANVVTVYLISGPWQPPEGGSAQSTALFSPNSLLTPISVDFPTNLLALLLLAVAVVAVILTLSGTRWGLNLRATGKNARSALLLGVPTTQSAMTALMVCGALAGIAGAYRVLFTYNSLRPLVSGGIGFLALLVVLLVGMRTLWAVITALAFATILGGSTRLRVVLQLDQSLAGVLQGLIVLTVMLTNGIKARLLERDSSAPEEIHSPPDGILTTAEIMRPTPESTEAIPSQRPPT